MGAFASFFGGLDAIVEHAVRARMPRLKDEQPAAPVSDPDAEPEPIPTITTPDDLEAFIWDRFGIRISKHRCCPEKGHCSPWEAFCYAYFATGSTCIWKASRGFGGKSFMLSLLCEVEAITLRADVKIMAGSGQQAQRVLKYTADLWNLPRAPRHLVASQTKYQTTFTEGHTIEALLASTKSARGPHPQRLRMDEIDEMKLAILTAASGQTISKGEVLSQTVLSSTHQYPKGTFTAQLKEAAEKGWPVFEWCYRANLESNGGWLPDAEVARKRNDVNAAMWLVEYEGQEPSPEGRAFDSDAVRRMFDPDIKTIEESGADGATYGTGADWARKVDKTVICTLRREVKPYTVAALSMENRKPWPMMIQRFVDRLAAFPGTNRHDRTGLGDVVHDFAGLAEEDGIIMVGRERSDVLSEYVLAVERDEIRCEWPAVDDLSETSKAIRQMKTDHLYATVDDLYRSSLADAKLPDTIQAGACAYRAVSGAIAAGVSQDPEPPKDGGRGHVGAVKPRLGGLLGLRRPTR